MKRNELKEKQIYPFIKDDILPGLNIEFLKVLKIFTINKKKTVIHDIDEETIKNKWDELRKKGRIVTYDDASEYILFQTADGYLFECEIKEDAMGDLYFVSTDVDNIKEKALSFFPHKSETFIAYKDLDDLFDKVKLMYDEKCKDYISHFSKNLVQIIINYIKLNEYFIEKTNDEKKLNKELSECFSDGLRYVPNHTLYIVYKNISTTYYGKMDDIKYNDKDELILTVNMNPIIDGEIGHYTEQLHFKVNNFLTSSCAVYEDENYAIFYNEYTAYNFLVNNTKK